MVLNCSTDWIEGIYHHYRRIKIKPLPEFSEKYNRMNQIMKLSCAFLLLFPLAAFANEGGEASKTALPPEAIPAPDNINTYLHLQVNSLRKAQAPQVKDRKLILTWKGDAQPRYVAAAFKHEAYRQKHLFWRNQNGVYFLVLDLAADAPALLEYRLVVDGLWQGDPTNPDQIRDDQGISLSRVAVKPSDLPAHAGPVLGYFGEVEFAYHGKPGQQVSVIGNFNQWDPFAHFMEEAHPGEYHLKVTLPPGLVLYRFVVGTRSFLDPGNAKTGHDAQGGTFSFLENTVKTPAKILDATVAVAAAHH